MLRGRPFRLKSEVKNHKADASGATLPFDLGGTSPLHGVRGVEAPLINVFIPHAPLEV